MKGNIWSEAHRIKGIVVIPTNGCVKNNGSAVMGRGLARQAVHRLPDVEKLLGKALQEKGNHVFLLSSPMWGKVITFPVKSNWWEKAELIIIERSAKELADLHIKESILMSYVGCGNGRLDWKNVKPIIDKYIPNVIIVDWKDK